MRFQLGHRVSILSFAVLTSGAAALASDIGFRQATHSETPLTLRPVTGGVDISDRGKTKRVSLAADSWMQAIERVGSSGWVVTGTSARLDGRDLVVKVSLGSGVKTLPSPRAGQGPLAWWPLPIVHRSELLGLVWLEGARLDRLAVVAARWQGDAWSQPVVVSPPGPGSQTGLTATVLRDGTWLLAWTRFDGEDDEIVWSTGDGRGFGGAVLLGRGNSVADIQPDLLADGNGALIAWSREQAGRYILRMARFDGRSWSEMEVEPMTAVAPKLRPGRGGGAPWLSLWTVENGAPSWLLARPAGARLAVVQRVDGARPRPAVRTTEGTEPRFAGVPRGRR